MPKLDLNLLITLDALLQERSVTRAAERLGLSQPTVSASLGRLRRHFNDELLYRSGNTYDLTPLAVRMAGRTGVALEGVQRVFALQPNFEPLNSEREFTIICSDYGAVVVGPLLTARLATLAPHMRVHLRQGDPGPFGTDEDRLRTVDGVLMPHGYLHLLPHLDMYQDRWVCLVCADNASVGETLSIDDLSRLTWATTFRGPSSTSALRQLSQRGVQARVQVVVDSFLGMPYFITGTDRIALMPYRLAQVLQPHFGLRILECPIEVGPVVEALWWHPDFDRDAEHVWLREQFTAIAADVLRGAGRA